MNNLPDDFADYKPHDIDALSDNHGRSFNRIKTNQIRNFFSRIISIRTYYRDKKTFDQKIERDLIMLKPLLAYASRHREVKIFRDFMVNYIDKVIESKNKVIALDNFFSLVEGIVAYHKFYGGKEN